MKMQIIFFFFFLSLCFTQFNKKKEIVVGDTHAVQMEVTGVQWGFISGSELHIESHGDLSEDEIHLSNRVLDETNRPNRHENHDYIMTLFGNSSVFKELTKDNLNSFLWNKKPMFIFMLCNCERDREWGVGDELDKQITKKYGKELNFLYALPETINHYNLISTFKISRLPTVIIDNIPMGSNNEKYRIRDDISSWSWRNQQYAVDNIISFIDDFKAGTAPLVVRSEDVKNLPWTEEGKMWHLVGKNFKDIVIDDEDYDFLVLVYSPNSPACKAILPLFNELAESLAKFKGIKIAAFDKTKNDFPIPGLFIRFLPTLYFFPARHKYESINFYDFRSFKFTEEGLIGFIGDHSDNHFDTKKALKVIKNKPKKSYQGDCIKITTEKEFQEIVMDSEKDVFVDFMASWCGYCRMMLPELENICTYYKNTDVKIVKIDCADDKANKLCNSKGIRAYPTLRLYTKQDKTHPIIFGRGKREAETFKKFIESHIQFTPKIQYGQNGRSISKEQPCLIKNGDKIIDLTKIKGNGEDDDFMVESPTSSEYEFFIGALCKPTVRKCLHKKGNAGAIQIGIKNPKDHCYHLGLYDAMEAQVIKFGDSPITEVTLHSGDITDDFRTRTTKINVICDPTAEETKISFLNENQQDDTKIAYFFEMKSKYACNSN